MDDRKPMWHRERLHKDHELHQQKILRSIRGANWLASTHPLKMLELAYRRPTQRARKSRHLVQNALFTALRLRAAGIEADGNDPSPKIKAATKKLTKEGRTV